MLLDLLFNKKTTGMIAPKFEKIYSPEIDTNVGAVSNMLWDTKDHMRRNVREICDELGLSFDLKNKVCACIHQESNWTVQIISRANTNGTKDWGIVQVNDDPRFWIGKGLYFSSTCEVLENPEKCVRFMVKLAKAGRLYYWSSYSSGAYKKYLKEESVVAIPY